MGKPKVVQPGKQEKNPKVYPVDRYPYMAVKPYGKPQYFQTHTEAVRKLREEVFALADQFGPLDSEIVEKCADITLAIGKLPGAGGRVDMLVDPYTQTWYRVELVRRQAA